MINSLILNAQTIDQIKKQMKDAGISRENAIQTARDKGFSDNKIEEEARSRGIDIGGAMQSDNGQLKDQNTDFDNSEDIIDNEYEVITNESVDITESNKLEYFGYQDLLLLKKNHSPNLLLYQSLFRLRNYNLVNQATLFFVYRLLFHSASSHLLVKRRVLDFLGCNWV